MNIKVNSLETKCSNHCWNCNLRGTAKCYKVETELRPMKNPFRKYHWKWERRSVRSMDRAFVHAFNQKAK
jgi:hypothetical protein